MPAKTAAADSIAVRARNDSLSSLKPTETFRGTYKNQEILFSHRNYQSYTLTTAGQVRNGHLNTERGYGDYTDATLYVLDDDKPEKEQKYFVRTTAGSVFMLDKDRYVVDEAVFNLVADVTPKPVLAKKLVAIKTAKKNPVVKKPALRKTSVNKNIKKSRVAKKTSTKKFSKSSKKKKPVRSARKRKHKKKPAQETQKQ
jgi:hypothetical protein